MGEEEGQSEMESAKEGKESFEMTETSKKIIRVITVTTYLFSVSMAAIMLSLYYLFFWNPTVQSGSQRLVDPIRLHFSRLYFNVTQKGVNPAKRWKNAPLPGKRAGCGTFSVKQTNRKVGSKALRKESHRKLKEDDDGSRDGLALQREP